MAYRLRGVPVALVLLLAPSFVAAGLSVTCGGTSASAAVDAGSDGGDDATSDASGDDSGAEGDACNPTEVFSPTITVVDGVTMAPICNAVLVGDSQSAGLFACDDPVGCTGTCPYTVTDLSANGSATFSATIGAPGHASKTVSGLETLTCGCGAAPCVEPQAMTVALAPVADASPSDGGSAGPCPKAPPHTAEACTEDGLYCEYGTNPNAYCDGLWECVGTTWENKATTASCPSGLTCPSYEDISGGGPCSARGETCNYAQGTCECTSTPNGFALDATTVWACTSVVAGCPEPRPNLGTSCAASGPATCDYGACNGNVALTCSGGVWTLGKVTCPG